MRALQIHALIAAAMSLNTGCAALEEAAGEPDPPPPARQPAPRAIQLESFKETISGTTVEFDMVAVNAPGHRPFWIGRTEVTWDMYDVFVFELDKPQGAAAGEGGEKTGPDAVARPSRPYVSPDLGYGHDGYAAISLAYLGAEQFCTWMSAKTGRRYRLPTEAEWKRLCELSGITAETADDYAWHDLNADFSPHPVGSRKADALGLHDLWGNVREWCKGDDGKQVALGGSFMDLPEDIGCGSRHEFHPDWQMTDPQVPKSKWWLSDAPFAGFRILCEPAPQEGAIDERK